ncbi:MAG: GGDEF domain-containing protein, partial [Gammaproteobacteria bacterium]|nr:GGDEF domain-containing protein [Gammaproteobacteria bacterium]
MDTKHTLAPEQQREALLGALLQATANLTKGHDVTTILQSFCDALVVASPHIRMAWIYLGEPDPDILRPTYSAGPARPHPATLAIGRDPAAMQGPARRTLTTGKPVMMRVATDPGFAPWRESALAQGLRSVASIAFHAPGSHQAGMIAVGADTDDYFELVGLEPIIAFARLGEGALAQAADRRRLEDLATFDHLSGLLNRRSMENLLAQEHARAQRHKRPYSLLLFDIDRFKLINDSYGHGVGDQVLIRLAQVIRGALRQSDSVARWGGEEFLCLLPETGCDEAMIVAEHLRHHIADHPIQMDERSIRITVSIGLACFPNDADGIETL